MSKPFKIYVSDHRHRETSWALPSSTSPTPEAHDAPAPDEFHEPEKHRRRRTLSILLSVLIILVTVVGIRNLNQYLHLKHQARIEMLHKWTVWNTQIRKISDNAAQIRGLSDKAKSSGRKAQGLLSSGDSALKAILGHPFRSPPLSSPIEISASALHDHVTQVSQTAGALEELARHSTILATASKKTSFLTSLETQLSESSGTLTLAQRIAQSNQTELAQARGALAAIQACKLEYERHRKEEQRVAEKKRSMAEAREKEEALGALVKAEIERINEAHDGAKTLAGKFKPEESLQILATLQSTLKTDQGKKIMGQIVDQYTRLRNMKLTLIKDLNTTPFAWGWGWEPYARDVLGADESNVKLKNQLVPWSEVSASQMKKFFDRYLMNDKTKMSTLATFKLAAAIYFQERGYAATALNYARETIRDYEWMREYVNRLLSPELVSQLHLSEGNE